MPTTPDKDDEQWLNALAGRMDSATDVKTNTQAHALRRALQARAEKLEAKVPYVDEDQYQQLLFRLRREKLLVSHAGWRDSSGWRKAAKVLGLQTDVIPWRSPAVWGLVTTLVLGVAVVIQSNSVLQVQNEADVLRGGTATTLIVAEPETRLAEILAGLRTAGGEPDVKRLNGGGIVITVAGNPKVLDYLGTQRIEPVVLNGKIVILLTRPKVIVR
jgi:hypothetical protein